MKHRILTHWATVLTIATGICSLAAFVGVKADTLSPPSAVLITGVAVLASIGIAVVMWRFEKESSGQSSITNGFVEQGPSQRATVTSNEQPIRIEPVRGLTGHNFLSLFGHWTPANQGLYRKANERLKNGTLSKAIPTDVQIAFATAIDEWVAHGYWSVYEHAPGTVSDKEVSLDTLYRGAYERLGTGRVVEFSDSTVEDICKKVGEEVNRWVRIQFADS